MNQDQKSLQATIDRADKQINYWSSVKEQAVKLKRMLGDTDYVIVREELMPEAEYNTGDITMPSKWSATLKWDETVIFLLKELNGEGFVNDIVSAYMKYDRTANQKKIKQSITLTASRLYDGGKGILDAELIKNKNKYKLRPI